MTLLAPPALAALLATCGGGGSQPTPGTAAPPLPTAIPSNAAGAIINGTAVDDTSGLPIAGASVRIGGVAATSGADGSFSIANVPPSTIEVSFAYVGSGYPVYPNAQLLEIDARDGHATYRALHTIAPAGTTNLGTVAIALPTATDIAWLKQINHDRTVSGAPAVTAPLTFDSVTLETARYWAQQMNALGFLSHTCPPSPTTCTEFWLYETERGGYPSAQNVDRQPNGTWTAAEAAFMAETANCPNGNWQTCPFGETTGHYINIMAAAGWAGVGSAGTYFVENFGTPVLANALYSAHVPQHSHAL